MGKKITYIFLMLTLLLAGCAQKRTGQKETLPVQVRVMTVETSENVMSKKYVGTAVPSKSAVLSAKYAGTLVSVQVSRGVRVKKGDIIAVVESQNVKSMAESAEATLRQAEDGYERARMMYDKGGLADVKMVEIETKLAQARATAKAASKAVEDCVVRAPFDGTISDVYAEVGMDVSLMAPLARIYDMSSMKITFSVPENEIGNLKVGDIAVVEVPALASTRDRLDVSGIFRAELTEKGISGSVFSHSYECTLVPVAECRELMPGMVCKISTGSNRTGIVIPSALVRTDNSGKYVWGVTDEYTVRKIYVTTGEFVSRGVAVTSGLEEGELVITEGMQKVSTGMKVQIME